MWQARAILETFNPLSQLDLSDGREVVSSQCIDVLADALEPGIHLRLESLRVLANRPQVCVHSSESLVYILP